MLANVTCPNCQHKYWLQEGEMGSRQTCPSCRSEFFAGKSSVEARAGAAAGAAPKAGYAKTMLTESSPPIKYKCPRCQAPLEAASIEAGTKKNCPNCTQRHQVPAAAAAPASPALNKTMLAGDDAAAAKPPIKYNCPSCKKPLEAPAEQAGTKRNCPHCNQRLQVPAAARNKTMLAAEEGAEPARASQAAYAADSPRGQGAAAAGPAPAAGAWPAQLTPRNIAIAVGALLLLWMVISWIKGPPQIPDPRLQAEHDKELERIRGEIELKKQEQAQQFKAQQDADRRHEERLAEAEEARRRANQEYLVKIQGLQDDKLKATLESERKREQQRQQEAIEALERKHQDELEDSKRKLEESKRALEAANQKQTVIQTQPTYVAPPIWHPRYYSPWWW